jgi:hypothetical protein
LPIDRGIAKPLFQSQNGITFQSKVDQDGSELNVVQSILQREEELKSLISLSSNINVRPLWICDLAYSLVRLRHQSCRVAEAIQTWRKPQTRENPFFWEKENYLMKMWTDCTFLRSARRILTLFPFMMHCNPLFQFDRAYLERVAKWSPGAQILLNDETLPASKIANATQVLEDELRRHNMGVTNTGHLEKQVDGRTPQAAPGDAQSPGSEGNDPFNDPHPGAALFKAHRKHVLTTGSMKEAAALETEVRVMSQKLIAEEEKAADLEDKVNGLERSLMSAASEGLTLAVANVTEGLDNAMSSAYLQDFLGGKRLRVLREESKTHSDRMKYLRVELEIRKEDAENQCERWNMKRKEKQAKRKRMLERKRKELERRGMRMSKGRKPAVKTPKSLQDPNSPPKEAGRKHVSFEVDKETGNARVSVVDGTHGESVAEDSESHPETKDDVEDETKTAAEADGKVADDSEEKVEYIFKTTKDGSTGLEAIVVGEGGSAVVVGYEGKVSSPTPVNPSSLVPSSPVPTSKTSSPPGKKKATAYEPLDLSKVDVHLFDNRVWNNISTCLLPPERMKLSFTCKDVKSYVETSLTKTGLLSGNILHLQTAIDRRAVEARTSLDATRKITRDIQDIKKKDVKLLYREANQSHDRVARTVIEILVMLGIATSSTEVANPENVRRDIVFYEKNKISKSTAKSMTPKIEDMSANLHRRFKQLKDLDDQSSVSQQRILHTLKTLRDWFKSLVEYYFRYKSNVKRIDRMVESINVLRSRLRSMNAAKGAGEDEGEDVDDPSNFTVGNIDRFHDASASLEIGLKQLAIVDESSGIDPEIIKSVEKIEEKHELELVNLLDNITSQIEEESKKESLSQDHIG